jgi:hypothetical protein
MSQQQIEDLSNEFNTLLTEYKDTYQDYINVINSNDKSFTTMPNFSFIGENNINTLNNSSLSSCKNVCSENPQCSGATFNNILQICTLSDGKGSIVNTQQSTAIVQQAIFYSYKLQQLNSQLSYINKQIMDNYKNNIKDLKYSQERNNALNNNYNVLANERIEIEHMIRQFETLNTAYQDGNINANSNYYIYITLLFITIILLFILVKYSISNQQRGGGKLTWNNNFIITLLCVLIIFFVYKIIYN